MKSTYCLEGYKRGPWVKLIAILFVSLLVSLPTYSQDSVAYVMNEYFNAIGGKNILRTLKSSHEIKEIKFNDSYLNAPFGVTDITIGSFLSMHNITRLLPVFERGEVTSPNWKSTYYRNQSQSGMLLDGRFVIDPMVNRPYPVIHMGLSLLESFEEGKFKYSGKEIFWGEACYKVIGPYTPDEEPDTNFMFSVESGLLKGYNGIKPFMSVVYSDYKVIQGINTPLLRSSYYKNILFNRENIISLSFNVAVNKDFFYFQE